MGRRLIIPRSEWTNRRPSITLPKLQLPVSELWVHHAAGASAKGKTKKEVAAMLRGIQNFHMDTRDYSDIGYCFAVDANGRVWRLRGTKVGAHTYGRNDDSIGVLLLGNFEVEKPTTEMICGLQDLREWLVNHNKLTRKHNFDGHKNAPLASTACPGRYAMKALRRIK